MSLPIVSLATANLQITARTNSEVQAQIQRQLREEQQRIQADRARRDQERQSRPAQNPIRRPAKPSKDQSADARCQQIQRIYLDGTTQMSRSTQAKVVKNYLQKCLTAQDINELLTLITNWYFDNGFISSRSYIQPQDLTTGDLHITVIEGKVEAITSDQYTQRILDRAFVAKTTRKDNILNLRDIEQGLDQINRLQSHQAKMELVPGKEVGGSVVALSSEAGKPVSYRLNIDNTGQQTTGEEQLNFTASWDNPLGLLDFASLSLGRQAKNVGSDVFSRSASLHYDMPFRYWNMDVDISWYGYSLEVDSFNGTFITSGISRNQSLRISRLVVRDDKSKSGVRFSLARKDSLNFVEDVRVETSSRVLTSIASEFWHERFLKRGVWNSSVTWSRGLGALGGASDRARTAPTDPKAKFSKFSISSSLSHQYEKALPFSGYNIRLAGQYSDDPLYSAEQISVGSQHTVRGFKGVGQGGEKGAYLRQELTMPMPSVSNSWKRLVGSSERKDIQVQGTLSLDGGIVRTPLASAEKYSRFSSVSFGVRVSNSFFNLNAEYAKGLSSPSGIGANDHDFYLQAGAKF